MILFTDTALLSPTIEYPLTHTQIGFHTVTRDGTLSASTETAGHPAYAAGLPNTYESWIPTTVPAWIKVDAGTAIECDYFGIAAHNIGSTGASITCQYSLDNVIWEDITVASFTTDTPIIISFAPVTARYWRIYITGVAPTIGVWYVGKGLQMQRPIYGGHSPVTMSRNTVVRSNRSEGGQFLGRYIVRSGVSTQYAYKNLTADWVRGCFDKFILSAREYPYFIAWRPLDYPREVAYGWTTKDISPSNIGIRDLMQVSFDIQGIGDYEGSDVDIYPGGC